MPTLADLPPRTLAEPTDAFFASRSAHSTWLKLGYLLERGHGFALLTGEIGCGKSLLLRKLIDAAEALGHATVHVPFPLLSVNELLAVIDAGTGGSDGPADRSSRIRRIVSRLASTAEEGRGILMAIDDAHLIASDEVFDAIGLLTNLRGADRGLTIVLAGQLPLLAAVKGRPSLSQRIDVAAHLAPFDAAETADYVRQRTACENVTLDDAASAAVYAATGGTPRLIERLCEMAVVVAEADGNRRIGPEIIEAVAAEFLGSTGF